MSGGEQFSLCWDSFHKNLSSGMQALLETEDLVDVTLAVEGKYLKAHKMVLSLCSPYFRELFSVNPCKHPIVFMKDVSYLALSDLLTFMYQGEVQVNQEHLGTFIKTAEALQIKGLTGDSSGSHENDSSEPHEDAREDLLPPTVHKPKTFRNEEESKPAPAPRVKKQHHPMPGPSPSPKRQKLIPATPDVKHTPKTENMSSATPSTPLPHEILQFKVEPYETGDHSNIENIDDNQGDNFDETVDDSHVDDTEDYSMIEGEEEPQAGTSAEGMGDGQDSRQPENTFTSQIAGNSQLTNNTHQSEDKENIKWEFEEILTQFPLEQTSSQNISNANPIDQSTRVENLVLQIKEQNTQIQNYFQHFLNRNFVTHTGRKLPENLPVQLPLKTVEDLDVMEIYLHNGENSKNLVSYFIYLGGNDFISKVNRILKTLLTYAVGQNCNFYGKRSNKIAFSKYVKIKSVIIEATTTSCPEKTEADVERAIKIWLKHCPEKEKYELRKKNRLAL